MDSRTLSEPVRHRTRIRARGFARPDSHRRTRPTTPPTRPGQRGSASARSSGTHVMSPSTGESMVANRPPSHISNGR